MRYGYHPQPVRNYGFHPQFVLNKVGQAKLGPKNVVG
jgi:hypothetical protein